MALKISIHVLNTVNVVHWSQIIKYDVQVSKILII